MAGESSGLERRNGGGVCLQAHVGDQPGRPTTHDRGFTLIEMLVALTMGGLAVLLAHQIFAAVVDRGQSLVRARMVLDHEVNARRWLDAAFLSLDVGVDSAGGFDGQSNRVRFASWLRTPDGWFERRAVVLERDHDRMVATATPGDPIALMDNVMDLQLEYLLEPGGKSRWVREWVSPVSAPVAVRLRVTRAGEKGEGARAVVDTVLFIIQERG